MQVTGRQVSYCFQRLSESGRSDAVTFSCFSVYGLAGETRFVFLFNIEVCLLCLLGGQNDCDKETARRGYCG